MTIRYRARALLLLPLCANAGMLLGPLLGGLLSSQRTDGTTDSPYPYLRPNLLIAALYLLAAVGVFFGLEETLATYSSEDSIARRAWAWLRSTRLCGGRPPHHAYAPVDTEMPVSPGTRQSTDVATAPPDDPALTAMKPGFRRIWTFNVVCTMLAHLSIAGHLATFATLWSVFLSTPVERGAARAPPLAFSGGLGLQPRAVGAVMSALGAIVVALQVLVYPRLNDRFGTLPVWRAALYAFPIAYALAPFSALAASADPSAGARALAPEWIAVAAVLLVFGVGRTGVTPATTLLINDCAPHPAVRATIHSTATVLGNLARSVFPVAALAVFGEGLRVGVVGAGFWCLTGLAALSILASRWVRDGAREE